MSVVDQLNRESDLLERHNASYGGTVDVRLHTTKQFRGYISLLMRFVVRTSKDVATHWTFALGPNILVGNYASPQGVFTSGQPLHCLTSINEAWMSHGWRMNRPGGGRPRIYDAFHVLYSMISVVRTSLSTARVFASRSSAPHSPQPESSHLDRSHLTVHSQRVVSLWTFWVVTGDGSHARISGTR